MPRPPVKPVFPSGGYSLLELTIVVLVIGILVSAATPRLLKALTKHRATATAMRIKTDLELARREAKKSSRHQTVEFHLDDNRYVLAGMDDMDHPDQVFEAHVGDPAYGAQLVSASFGGATEVTFDMYGQPNHAGSVVIQVGNHQEQISVDTSGQITRP